MSSSAVTLAVTASEDPKNWDFLMFLGLYSITYIYIYIYHYYYFYYCYIIIYIILYIYRYTLYLWSLGFHIPEDRPATARTASRLCGVRAPRGTSPGQVMGISWDLPMKKWDFTMKNQDFSHETTENGMIGMIYVDCQKMAEKSICKIAKFMGKWVTNGVLGYVLGWRAKVFCHRCAWKSFRPRPCAAPRPGNKQVRSVYQQGMNKHTRNDTGPLLLLAGVWTHCRSAGLCCKGI